MCWMCHERETSSYRACDGCSNLVEKQDVIVYDILMEWKHLAEFVEQKKRILVFCANCRDAMNAYREATRQHVAQMEPYVWHHYADRSKDEKHGTLPVGVHCLDKTLGIRCSQLTYGLNATEEILQGFLYHDVDGHQIRRLTIEDVDETTRCDTCWLKLYECNAREVTR